VARHVIPWGFCQNKSWERVRDCQFFSCADDKAPERIFRSSPGLFAFSVFSG